MEGNNIILPTEAGEEDHDLYRILLYYCYISIPDVALLIHFHQSLNEDTNYDRKNVNSPKEIHQRRRFGGRIRVAPEGINGVLSGTHADLLAYETLLKEQLAAIAPPITDGMSRCWELDMKYCQLRRDLKVQEQMFQELQVQKTSQVVALVDMSDAAQGEKDENAGMSSNHTNKSRYSRRSQNRKQKQCNEDVNALKFRQAQDIFHRSLLADGEAEKSAPHLSPTEWDARLQESIARKDSKVVLLDCRNSYESAVGYFQVPGASTVLTNTRKYSELPFVLMNETDESLADASAIFMYCTGGVRCERASGFLRTFLNDKRTQKEGELSKHESKIPEIYQLHGGIQRYIEDSSTRSLFLGKNFVFDPRRTDPLMGSAESLVGQCIVCSKPHDDYDNGHAPSLNMEARCFKCRVLVLVCNQCRTTVTCWGDDATDNKPKLFCSGVSKHCVHRPPVRTIRS
jgi:predicted sulfurtransferase